MLAAGFKNYKIWYDDKEWNFYITDPLKIEIPNALATVVTNWNKPMHEFLKKRKCSCTYNFFFKISNTHFII